MNINPSVKEAADKLAQEYLTGFEREIVDKVLAIPATTPLTPDEHSAISAFRRVAANHSILILE